MLTVRASAFLAAHGYDRWSRDCNVDFMRWIQGMWRDWSAETGKSGRMDAHQDEFDSWLWRRIQPQMALPFTDTTPPRDTP